MRTNTEAVELPGAGVDMAKMPGHWLLARMGKRVLRPGGKEMTEQMLKGLAIDRHDRVVELAPGLGGTARMALAYKPTSYIGVERDPAAADIVRHSREGMQIECRTGDADDTGLDGASATVIYGEAMLTMQSDNGKRRVVREAFRVLKPGGRYGIHEMGLTPDDVDADIKASIATELSRSIHIGARPLTQSAWRELLESEGFEVLESATAPMHLLEPRRVIADEGLLQTLKILWNVAWHPVARRRILAMRRVFRKHQRSISAVVLIARKPGAA